VRYDLAHLNVLKCDYVRNHRRNPLAHGLGGVLRLEDDHPYPRVVLSCPLPSYEPWGLRHPRYDLLAQMALSGVYVADRDRDDDGVDRDLLCRWLEDSIREFLEPGSRSQSHWPARAVRSETGRLDKASRMD
jgi:hypothetical protein